MAEWIGQLLSYLPAWMVLPLAFIVVTIGYIAYIWATGSDVVDRWLDRRKREKELEHGKK